MAQLNLELQYKSGENASIGVSGHEPNGEFWTYQVNAIETIDNSMAVPDASTFYPFVSPDKIKAPAITITPVDNMGVKKFIGWGAGAYYHPIDSEYSYLTLPIHYKLNEKEPPEMTITNNGNTVIFDIEQGAGVIYETVRLTVQQGNLREEKVVYFETGKPIHYEMVTAFKNLVTASVRAHANETNIISELVEEELNLGGTLEAVMTINQQSSSLFNHDFNAIGFSDDRGMSIENIDLVREVDGQYSTGGVSYTQEVFTSNGTFAVPAGIDKVDVLVVAGGGGGGSRQGGGGGGAGGLIFEENYSVTPLSNVSITVGSGGAGGGSGSAMKGSNGSNSEFGNLIAVGGGGGGQALGSSATAGLSGGSGGGAGRSGANSSGGDGTVGQGNQGGDNINSNNLHSGGGGGAGAAGENATSSKSGDGGDGLYFGNIFGTDVGDNGWFAGGGGSGPVGSSGVVGLGGLGGGGDSAILSNGANGMAGTGGGGGGASGDGSNNRAGGAGGSGVVIVRYATTSPSGAIIKTIPIPDQSTYGDDYVINVDEA